MKLQKVKLVVLTKEECIRDYSRGDLTPRMVCAAYDEEKFTCFKDSGSPLVVLDRVKLLYSVIGVVSFGKTCGEEDKCPSVFARVTTVLDWIINNIRGSQCN